MYSVPERSTPCNTTGLPDPVTNCVPETRIPLSAPPAGGVDGGGEEAAATAVVWPDVADAEPPAFVALTTTSSVSPR